ncbi:TrbI/VirB10 family protein [Rhizobium sp. LCM 4573]|uniref:TrbI/VirB10 family protein n=1 Tax=Rhizobium sp. LCM 4573 TaxID=1848291 RepID=UPI0008D8E015|nr:TrbI/VirB10 family protein [Rhizobium sp. LCM 4573]OHV78535.1 conjugal transfer protein TrbI [Rhizobium sp. LCM 4573]
MTDNNKVDPELVADAQESPDFLPPPKKGKGVRRLNRIPLFVVGGLIAMAVIGVTYTLYQRQAANMAAGKGEKPVVTTTATPPVRPDTDYAAPPTPPVEVVTPAAGGPAETTAAGTAAAPAQAQPNERLERRLRLIERIEERRLSKMEEALDADMGVQSFAQRNANGKADAAEAGQGGANGGRLSGADLVARMVAAQNGAGGMGGMGGFGGMGMAGMADPNRQAEKRAFLSGTPEADTYLASTRTAAIAPQQEVKAGTVVPGVLISGINSDLPGQIIAQVREDVYDSATGANLLIPAGAKLIGTYDNGVTMGQSRALVAWTRIIYPDSSSVSLNMMPGADLGGYAGFNDQVDNHYLRIYGNALMLSLFSAGIQLSQPRNNNGDGYDSQQIMAAELGRQLGQLGMETTRRNMDIQPTLKIRPGYRFNVMVTKDIILPNWEGHPLATGQ